jgi:hypothetical protein
MNWHTLSLHAVQEIIAKNKNNEKVAALEDYALDAEAIPKELAEKVFENVVGQDSLTRFDRFKSPNYKKRRKNRKPKNGRKNEA